MENRQWLQQWLEKGSYTKEDVQRIAGKMLVYEAASAYTERDILEIVGPPSGAASFGGSLGSKRP